jgi:thioredoxin 1
MAIKVTDTNFDGIVSEGISMIDFFAVWCNPCKAMSPIVESLSEEIPNVKIGKLDVDDNPGISSKFGIRSIPTIIFFKDGEVVNRKVGMSSKEELRSIIESLIQNENN